MGMISGIGGAVNGIGTVREWAIQTSSDLPSGHASNTKGAPVVLAGNTDWSGTYRAYGHTPAVMPGETFAFAGAIGNGNGASGTARVSQVEISGDVETPGIIEHTVTFEAAGTLTKGSVSATDETLPAMFTASNNKVEVATPAAEPSFAELTDLRTWSITITASNPSAVSSSTAGVVTRYEGNLSATIALTFYADDFTDLPEINDVRAIRIYVNATEFWLFNWIRISEVTDLTVNIEDPNVVPASITGQWTGFTEISSTMTEGQIVDPAETEYWPADAT